MSSPAQMKVLTRGTELVEVAAYEAWKSIEREWHLNVSEPFYCQLATIPELDENPIEEDEEEYVQRPSLEKMDVTFEKFAFPDDSGSLPIAPAKYNILHFALDYAEPMFLESDEEETGECSEEEEEEELTK